jgi:TolB protein
MGARLGRATRWFVPLFVVLALTSCGGTGVVVVVGLSDSDQVAPAINGTMVAWEDYRNADAGDGSDVYARNMTSTPGPETLIAGGPGDQVQPAVSDQFIVWVDNSAIRARPRSGGNVINVATGNGDKFDPAVCGSLVVWTDMRNGNADIFGRNLAGGQEFPIAASPATEAYPDCDGNRVVYMSTGATTFGDISMFDRMTGATTVVSAQPWIEWQPAISGNRVVWQAWQTTGIDILGVDLSTGTPVTVTTGLGNQTIPDISGDGRGLAGRASHESGSLVPRPCRRDREAGGNGQRPGTPGLRRGVWQQQVNGSWDIVLKDL